MSCIFCKIINGDIPSYKIYEDDNIIAFLDITQTTIGHTLIIPKEHVENVFEWTPEISQHLSVAIPKIANLLKDTFPNMKGINLVNNNGEIAYQSVFHSHIHLIPRYTIDDNFKLSLNTEPVSTEQLEKIWKQFKK